MEEGNGVWRAQKGHGWRTVNRSETRELSDDQVENSVTYQEPIPHSKDRMKPMEGKASEGRANPKGIPYLYVAENKRTAVTEVRPWVGAWVTVSVLRTTRDLYLVDCSQGGYNIRLDEPPPEEWDEIVWQEVDRAFSRPVTREDDTASYAPTQIIADLFKREGYDGILYQSSLTEGRNVVLFDLDAAEVDRSELISVNSVSVDFHSKRH